MKDVYNKLTCESVSELNRGKAFLKKMYILFSVPILLYTGTFFMGFISPEFYSEIKNKTPVWFAIYASVTAIIKIFLDVIVYIMFTKLFSFFFQ